MVRKVLYILYQPYKWLIYFPILAVNTILFGIFAVLGSMLVNQRFGSYLGGVIWSRLNAILVPMIVRVEGKENIDKNTSYVVVPNHQSYYDIFLVYGWLGLDIKWIMKKELAKIPGVGFGSKKVGHIFLDRSNSRKAMESLNEARQKLVNGTSVVIFPEGTRSKTGELGSFKRGAFKLALDLNLPLLPVTIRGTRKICPTGTINVFPGRVHMTIHPPLNINDYNEKEMPRLMEDTRKIIEQPLLK